MRIVYNVFIMLLMSACLNVAGMKRLQGNQIGRSLKKFKIESSRDELNKELIEVVVRQDLEKVDDLIKAGADVNAIDPQTNESILYIAVTLGNYDMAQKLLGYGAYVNSINTDLQSTPLHGAVFEDYIELAALLLKYGAHVNAIDANGNTPLHLARPYAKSSENTGAGFQASPMIELLISYGANPEIQNNNNQTSGDRAIHSGKEVPNSPTRKLYSDINNIRTSLLASKTNVQQEELKQIIQGLSYDTLKLVMLNLINSNNINEALKLRDEYITTKQADYLKGIPLLTKKLNIIKQQKLLLKNQNNFTDIDIFTI